MFAPITGWGGLAYNQSMNWTYRSTPLPLLMAAASEDIPATDLPVEIAMDMRRLWFFGVKELVSNRDQIIEAVRQCISWLRELL